jgi:hypothetical protein
MYSLDDPKVLTPDERLQEIAGILAAGILRLRSRAALPTESDEQSGRPNSRESDQDCLEVPGDTVLSVQTG